MLASFCLDCCVCSYWNRQLCWCKSEILDASIPLENVSHPRKTDLKHEDPFGVFAAVRMCSFIDLGKNWHFPGACWPAFDLKSSTQAHGLVSVIQVWSLKSLHSHHRNNIFQYLFSSSLTAACLAENEDRGAGCYCWFWITKRIHIIWLPSCRIYLYRNLFLNVTERYLDNSTFKSLKVGPWCYLISPFCFFFFHQSCWCSTKLSPGWILIKYLNARCKEDKDSQHSMCLSVFIIRPWHFSARLFWVFFSPIVHCCFWFVFVSLFMDWIKKENECVSFPLYFFCKAHQWWLLMWKLYIFTKWAAAVI